MDHSLPGPTGHGILQARILEWVIIPFCKGSSLPRDQTRVSCIAGRLFTFWATRESQRLTSEVDYRKTPIKCWVLRKLLSSLSMLLLLCLQGILPRWEPERDRTLAPPSPCASSLPQHPGSPDTDPQEPQQLRPPVGSMITKITNRAN